MAETIITDKTEALAAVKNSGYALSYVSDELQTDPEILGGVDIDFLKKRGFS